MKLKSFISILTAGVFLLSACTDEDVIDRSIPNSGVSISLTTKGVVTKAAADGYDYATSEEIQINTCAIAFFDELTGDRMGFKYQSFNQATGNLGDGRTYYEVSDILVKGGSYNMLVLANSSLPETTLEAATTYASFKALKEQLADQGAATFQANNLVKFGEKPVTINKGQSNNIEIELTQLAARVDLSFKVNVPAEEISPATTELKYTLNDLLEIAKNPETYVPGSNIPGECKMHTHSDGKWLYVPNNVKTTTITKKSWLFTIETVLVSNVALKSDAFMSTSEKALNTNDVKEYRVNDYQIELSGSTATVPFYTYEKTYSPQENPLTIRVNGTLKYGVFKEKTIETFSEEYRWASKQGGNGWGQDGYFDKTTIISSETKTVQEMDKTLEEVKKSYKLVFNPTKSETCRTDGIVHGNLYDVVGTIDVNTREATFNWELKPWQVIVREVSVDIVDPAFLVVARTEMTMPNITSISTTFQSSSPIKISDIKVTNGTSYSNLNRNITNSEGNNGSINISSELPINFVPKEISFKVTNEEGLSEDVTIHQYPPLYISNYVSKTTADGGSGQTNSKMYIFKTLIADYSSLQDVSLQLDETWSESGWGGNGHNHKGTLSERQAAGAAAKADFKNAVLGYPQKKLEHFGKVSSKQNTRTETTYTLDSYVDCTVAGAANNNLISPHFVLASQVGVNSGKNETTAKEFCAGYIENDNSGNIVDNKFGSWRVPTKSELLLIDILQNTVECDVKKILEGEGYWSAIYSRIDFMDPRVSATNAVRCVRDIYE